MEVLGERARNNMVKRERCGAPKPIQDRSKEEETRRNEAPEKPARIFHIMTMVELNPLLKSIFEDLQAEYALPHRASSIAFNLFRVEFELKRPAIYLGQDLISIFINKILTWNLEDLLIHQQEYAIRIATSQGDILYEEMHKLFDLCDEVYALRYIGLESDKEVDIKFEKALKSCFKKEKRKARLVADDKYEEWKAQFWWYSNNLGA